MSTKREALMRRLLLLTSIIFLVFAASAIKYKISVKAQTAPQTVQTQDVSLQGGGNSTQRNPAEQRFYRRRANAQGVVPPGVRHRAMEQLRQMWTPADDRLQWTFIGPMPTMYAPGMPYDRDRDLIFNGAPTSGRVTALAVHPSDANTVYLGAAEGGVWKTTDGGAHWRPIFDFEDSLAIGSIAIDPQHSNTIYVGTGDDQVNFGFNTLYGDGIYKSIDGGATWRHTQNVLATSPLA